MVERVVFRGKHLAVARGARLALFEIAGDALRSVGDGEAPTDIAALCVAPHMPWVVGRDAEHRQVWWWRPGDGARALARRTGSQDHAIGSIVEIAGESFVALSQSGRLRLVRSDGSEAAAAARAAVTSAIHPIDDIRSTASYRRKVAANLVARFFA